MLIRFIVGKNRVTIVNAEKIKLNKFLSKVIRFSRIGSMFLVFMNTILNSVIGFQIEYNKRFLESRLVDILKYMMGPAFLSGTSVQSNHRCIQVVTMLLTYKNVLVLVEWTNNSTTGFKSVFISYSDDVGLYKNNTESFQLSSEQ